MSELTPLMKQYFGIKEQHPDAILFFRLGDFYEMFGEDARAASQILQITLTTRDKNKDEQVPMCGIPYFSADSYIAKLIKAGRKVAICEQVEDPKEAKGIVRREVVRVVTPGTHLPEQPKENAFIMSLFPHQQRTGVAVADCSTGSFVLYETDKPVEDELSRYEPREVLCPASLKENLYYKEALQGYFVTYADDLGYDYTEAYKALLRAFRVASLEGFGCEGLEAAIAAGGALIGYIEETQGTHTFKRISVPSSGAAMFLDASTKRNLELLHNLRDGATEGSLLWVLDETLTPMGGRFLRSALAAPLVRSGEINARLDAVARLIEDYELFEEVRYTLRRVQDIERLASRIVARTAVPRDLLGLRNSLELMPKLRKTLDAVETPSLKELAARIGDFDEAVALIGSALNDTTPATAREAGFIRKGYNAEVDELRDISTHGKDYIARLEADERQRTGISSLKIGFNKVFGYYIEVTKPNLDLVPQDYTRKQTLANCERFMTYDLKEYESKVLGAEDRLKELEYELFLSLLDKLQRFADRFLEAAEAVAAVDFYGSLAAVAKRYDYIRPAVTDGSVIDIEEGRHPVVERLISLHNTPSMDDTFIPNSALLDSGDNRLLIITGPNMAGKSTYMRQVALTVLMAQAGSFVPAASAKIGIVDRIFTRIGASDFIARGQSTFMVEMIETSNILNNATSKSLVILDEVGRGTSTFDGISIAWAVAEYLAGTLCARTLFATHYHELTDLSLNIEGVRNYNVVVKEWGEEVIFLRKIERGPADKSYGIQVARLAGLPDEVIGTAKVVLEKLEKKEASTLVPKLAQMDLFNAGDPVTVELMNLDLSAMKPQDALRKLKELKKRVEKPA